MAISWQDTICTTCLQPFESEEEFRQAHVAHSSDCPTWIGEDENCRCPNFNHARCCPDCNGKRDIQLIEEFKGHSTAEMLKDYFVAHERAEEASLFLTLLSSIVDPERRRLYERDLKFVIADCAKIASVSLTVLRARGIDPESDDVCHACYHVNGQHAPGCSRLPAKYN